MIILLIFGVILFAIGIELTREGIIKNNQYRPECLKSNDGDKEVIAGIFIMLAGIAGITEYFVQI